MNVCEQIHRARLRVLHVNLVHNDNRSSLYIRTNQGGQHGLQIYIWNRNFCGGVESVGKFLRQSVILMVDIGRSTCGRIQKF